MSHSKERAEKVCLNCDAELIDRYCHKCGQENIEPQQNLWHLVVHFFNDFTHFDGKFFSTIKLLMLKPGFLSLEYMKGRRAKYLDPIRMYIFTSAVAFLIFFSSAKKMGDTLTFTRGHPQAVAAVNVNDSSTYKRYVLSIDSAAHKVGEFEPRTVAQYDSFQKTLPPGERDNQLDQYFERRLLATTEKMQDPTKSKEASNEVLNKFLHSFPQLLFVSLPFFALILYLLNIRWRQKYFFVTHAIFTIHFYCASFIMLIVSLLLAKIPYGIFLSVIISVILPWVYLYMAMYRFYVQGWFKTTVKFLMVNVLSSVVILALFFLYLIYSYISIADI